MKRRWRREGRGEKTFTRNNLRTTQHKQDKVGLSPLPSLLPLLPSNQYHTAMLGRCFTPHTLTRIHMRGMMRTYATSSVHFTPSPLPGGEGVIYRHPPVTSPYPNVGAIKSTAASLTEEQQILVRKMRYELSLSCFLFTSQTRYNTPRSTTQHHAAPRSTTQHHAATRSTTQQHAAPRSNTQHSTHS